MSRLDRTRAISRLKKFSPFKSFPYIAYMNFGIIPIPGSSLNEISRGFKLGSLPLNYPVSSEFLTSHSRESAVLRRIASTIPHRVKATQSYDLVSKREHNSLLKLYIKGLKAFSLTDHTLYGFSAFKSFVRTSTRVPMNVVFLRYITETMTNTRGDNTPLGSLGKPIEDCSPLISSGYNFELIRLAVQQICKHRDVWTAGHDTFLPLLSRARESSAPFLSAEDILEVFQQGGDELLRLPLFDNVPSTTEQIRINPDSNPGLMTSKLFGKFRKYSIHHTKYIADLIISALHKSVIGYPCTWEPVGREKDVKVTDLQKGDNVLTRLCLHMEEPYMLILSMILQPINDILVRDKASPIMLGKELTGRSGLWFHDDTYIKFDYCVELDWPNFDIHVSSHEMLAAITVLRMCYPHKGTGGSTDRDPLIKYTDHLFVLLAHAIIHKKIVLGDGQTYKFENVLPSGLPGTSLIGSLINFLRWCVIGFHIYGPEYKNNMRIIVHGDDSLVLFKGEHDYASLIKEITKGHIGLDVDDIVVYPWAATSRVDLIPTFLKRKSIRGIDLAWDREKVIRKLLYPSRERHTLYDQLSIIGNYLHAARGDQTFSEFLYNYIKFAWRSSYKTALTKEVIDEMILKLSLTARDKSFDISRGSTTTVPVKTLLRESHRRFYAKGAPLLPNIRQSIGLHFFYSSPLLLKAIIKAHPECFEGFPFRYVDINRRKRK